MSYKFSEPYRKNKKTESKHKKSLGRWTRERGKEAEEEGAIEGDQHGLAKGDDQFDERQGGENEENQENREKQVTSLNEMRLVFE